MIDADELHEAMADAEEYAGCTFTYGALTGLRGILNSADESRSLEFGGDVEGIDAILVANKRQFGATSVTQRSQVTVTDTGQVYEIVKISMDPQDPAYEFQLRATP